MHGTRLAVRNLIRAPGYTLATVIMLALVMGANSALEWLRRDC